MGLTVSQQDEEDEFEPKDMNSNEAKEFWKFRADEEKMSSSILSLKKRDSMKSKRKSEKDEKHNLLSLPSEIIMIIYEFSDLTTIFRNLRLVSPDFFNITLNENFCERYWKMNNIKTFSKEIYQFKSFSNKMYYKYIDENHALFGGKKFVYETRNVQRYAENYEDKRSLSFVPDEQRGVVLRFSIDHSSSLMKLWGQGMGPMSTSSFKHEIEYLGAIKEVRRIKKLNGEEEEDKIVFMVQFSSFEHTKVSKSTKYPYSGEHEVKREKKEEKKEGMNETDLKRMRVFCTTKRRNGKKEYTFEVLMDCSKLSPFKDIRTMIRCGDLIGEYNEFGRRIDVVENEDVSDKNMRKFTFFMSVRTE